MDYIVWLSSLGDLKHFFKVVTIFTSMVTIILAIIYLTELGKSDIDKKIIISLITCFLLTMFCGVLWGLIPSKPISLKELIVPEQPIIKQQVDTLKSTVK